MRFFYSILLFVVAFVFFVPYLKCDTYDNNNYGHFLETSTESNQFSMLCMDIKPQHSLDIEQVMGMWYGSEIIKHTQDIPGIYHYDSCVIIYLADATDQMQTVERDYNYNSYRRTTTPRYQTQQQQQQQHEQQHPTKYLRLVWSEGDDNLEYTLNYTTASPGLWTNVGEQRGSLVALNQYIQFSGTVQVVKAVNDHLVLTFCGSDMKSSMYTIVLSRKPRGLSLEELRSIRNLLSRRGFSTETIRKVCTSGTAALWSAALLLQLSIYIVISRFL